MGYWIHENGETIGPLRAVELLKRAIPETLVSHGQKWVLFDEHPDFPGNETAGSSKASRIETPAKNQPTRIDGRSRDLNHPQLIG